jgi:flagellin-like protein
MKKGCIKKNNSKGLSPVIATVLLIAMVVVIGVIIFIWLRGLTREQITKFGGTNIEIVCDDVQFEADYTQSGTLSILNSGNVPIYNFKIKESNEGSYNTREISALSSEWKSTGLNQGGIFSDVVGFSGENIIITPVLIGESDEGKKTYTCDEKLHGYKIEL